MRESNFANVLKAYFLEKRKIILNTDIGQDFDDEFAIFRLLEANQVDLVAVVTTGYDPRLKAQYTRKLLDIAGVKIPVFYGHCDEISSKRAYLIERDYCFLTFNELKETDAESNISPYYIDNICRIIEENSGNVDFISIAPLTNVAEILAALPGSVNQIRRIYVMAGCVSCDDVSIWKSPEYNLRKSIESFHRITQSGADVFVVGKDSRLGITREELSHLNHADDLLAQTVSLHFKRYMDFMEKDFKLLSDPLTVAACIYPTLFKFIPITNLPPECLHVSNKQYHAKYVRTT